MNEDCVFVGNKEDYELIVEKGIDGMIMKKKICNLLTCNL